MINIVDFRSKISQIQDKKEKMEESHKKNQLYSKDQTAKIFPVQFAAEEIRTNIYITTDTEIKPSKEQIIHKAFKFHSEGNIKEAARYYQDFINQGYNDHRVFSNYGLILKNLGKLKEAEIILRKAIALKPDLAEAYSNLGNILNNLGNLEDAEISQRKAIALKPELANAHSNLGFILLQKGEHDLSLKYFSKSSNLLRGLGNQENNLKRFTNISKAKIKHDIEQFEYLANHSEEREKFMKLTNLYMKVASEIDWPSETKLIALSDSSKRLLKDSYNRLIHITKAPRLKSDSLNSSLNIDEITNDYFNHEFGLTYIDNFLSNSALKSLQKFLLQSTIWFDVKKSGYLGAYLKEGLANPLIIQIAEELRNKFPKIFKDFPISQIWAYKYDSRAKNKNSSLRGINIHADFAAINVNFWITPNKANLNPDSGGVIVYDVEAPKDWDFNIYNRDVQKMREELKKSKGNTKVIPYKENRAVVFNSNLFHETDSYEFKEGYENRRINITMLFGKRSVN